MADQYGGLGWEDPTMMNNLGAAYTDSSLYENGIYNDANGVSQNDGTGLPTEAASYSRQLVKRSMNQQLAQRARTPWDSFGGDIVGQQPPGWENTDDDEDLESKALLAKRDAQSKRKQIPPFVQKLSR
jgi:heat shock transcription factor